MTTKTYFFTAIAAYLISLIVLTPASSVLHFLNSNARNITLSTISGTLWNGSLKSVQIKNHQVTDLYWSFSAWRLLAGELIFDISANYLQKPVTSSIGTSLIDHIQIYNLSTTMDAYTVGNLANLPIGELSGEYIINIISANWSPNIPPEITGKVLWDNAGIIVAEKADLGNVIIDFIDTELPISATISNSAGDLDLDGQLTVSQDGQYSFDTKLLVKPSASRNLLQSLKFFAQKTGTRQYEINYSGKLNQFGLMQN